jgi:outer membrane receptor protein involved in Fe transport
MARRLASAPWPRAAVRAVAVLLTIASIVGVRVAGAQEASGTLRGRVVTEDALPLAFAHLHIVALGRHAGTDADGAFEFRDLPAGRYALRVQRLGYASRVVEVRIDAGSVTETEVVLTVSSVSLETLVITGTSGPRDPLSVPQQVDAIGAEQLAAQRDASLGALLARTAPGIANLSTGPGTGIPVIRGLSGTRVKQMQNSIGQEFYQYGVRHHTATSLSEAERIEVVRGVSSLLYGSDALGGAINVLTKDLPVATGDGLDLGARVETEYASVNGEVAGLVDVHGARGGVGVRAGIERRVAGDLQTPDGRTFFDDGAATGRFGDPKYTGALPFTNYEQWSSYAQLGIQGGFGRAELFANTWQSDQNYLLPPGGPVGSTTNPPLGVGLNLRNVNVSARGELIGNTVLWKPTLSFQRNVRRAAEEGVTFEDATDFVVDLEKDVFTGRLEAVHREGDGTFGVELQQVEGRRLGVVELEPSSTVRSAAIFGLEEFVVGRSRLALGARVDWRRQEADPNGLTDDPELLSQDYLVFSGSAGVSHPLADGVSLAVNLGTGFRAPTIFEMFVNGVHGGVAAFQRGDPTLDPERAVNGDVGLRVDRGRLRGEVTAYAQRIANYIFLANTGESTGGGLPILVSDQTDATLLGAEGDVSVALPARVAIGANAAFVRGTGDDLDDAGGDGALPLLPENRIGGYVEWEPSTAAAARGTVLRLGAQHFFARDAAGRIEPFSQFDAIPFGTASTEAYTLVSLEARTVLEVSGTPLSLSLSAENLLDTAFRGFLDTYKGYALSPGRNIRLRVSAPIAFTR